LRYISRAVTSETFPQLFYAETFAKRCFNTFYRPRPIAPASSKSTALNIIEHVSSSFMRNHVIPKYSVVL